jgi:hydrogenase expression/formation protein HypD
VFLAIGFETTAPAMHMSILQAEKLGLTNFSVLGAHVCVPPAMKAILEDKMNRVQGFLAAGHVCSVMGYWEYLPIAEKYKVPIVVTGFEPVDILKGILQVVRLLERNKYLVENAYSRVVTLEGNKEAQAIIQKVFKPCDRKWRGIGSIPQSGLCIREEYERFDAEKIFAKEAIMTQESEICIAWEILTGVKKPFQCTAFGKECTPRHPLGAPMVSGEGACSAIYLYKKDLAND